MKKNLHLLQNTNGRFEPLPEAGATEEQTLEAVGWKPVLSHVYTDFLVESVGQGFPCGLKIVSGLEIHPELCLHPKKASQS